MGQCEGCTIILHLSPVTLNLDQPLPTALSYGTVVRLSTAEILIHHLHVNLMTSPSKCTVHHITIKTANCTFLRQRPDPKSGFLTIMSTGRCWLKEVMVCPSFGSVIAVVPKSVLSSPSPLLNGVELSKGGTPSSTREWFGVCCSGSDGRKRGFTTNIFILDFRLGAKRQLIAPGTACCSLSQL